VAGFRVQSWEKEAVFDPACGAGDLLLPIARELAVGTTVSATLQSWNNRLFGCDLSHEFIEAARYRLMLTAVSRGAILDAPLSQLAKLLTNLTVADGLSATDNYVGSSCIIMNPPYGRVASGTKSWKEGMVTAAALFLERAAQLSSPGTRIAALLPEVLRTGTSYRHWRKHIAGFVDQAKPQSIGQFSAHADVDVFIQHFIKRNARVANPISTVPEQRTIGDFFTVAVGAVVPHRDPVEGPRLAFLHPKNAPIWSEMRRISETRKFDGRSFTPPFVVVRRTSRPGDRHRASATLVLGARKVAVENHLLVLSPKDETVESCRSLIQVLRGKDTDTFLDEVMRCRHLTTSSVASVPWK
jgi:SAM-dependent methyltransferase